MSHEITRKHRTRHILVWTAVTLALVVLFTGCPQNPFFGLQPSPRDEEGPEVTIINPEEGQVLSGLLVITGITTDKYQVSSVSIRIDSGDPIELEGTYNWYYPLDTTALTEGSHKATIIAEDEFGNSSETVVSFVVDQTVPSVNFNMDAEHWNWIAGTNLQISGSASDDRGVDRVQVSFNGVNYSNASYSAGTDTWSYTIPDTATIVPGDGTNVIYLRVVDGAGQLGTTQFPFYIVNAAPAFTFVNPAQDQNIDGDLIGDTLTIDITADDQVAVGDVAEDALDYIDILITSTASTSAFTDIAETENPAVTGTNTVDIDITEIRNAGPADIQVTAYNKSGTSFSSTVAVSFDADPPSIGATITADSAGDGPQTMDDDLTNEFINFTGEVVRFEGTAAPGADGDIAAAEVKMMTHDGSTVFDYVDMIPGLADGSWGHEVDFSGVDPNGNPYVDGEYEIVFRVTEDETVGGGGIATANRTLRIDRTAQAVVITDPEDGIFIGEATEVPIIGAVDISTGSPLASIEIDVTDTGDELNNETYGPFNAAAGWAGLTDYSNGQFSFSWDNTDFSTDEELEIVVRAYDLAGNEGTSETVTVQKDATAPGITFDSYDHPTNDGWTGTPGLDTFINGNATITGSATDNSGIASVEVQLNGGSFEDLGVSGGPSTEWNYTLPDLSEGEHTIVVRVTDDGVSNSTPGARQNTRSLTFTVDNDPPSLTNVTADVTDGSGTSYLHGDAEIMGNSSDSVAGVESVTVTVDESPGDGVGEDPESLVVTGTTSFSASWNTEALPTVGGAPVVAQNGIGVQAIATDAAGNATVVSISPNVDVRPYVATISVDTALLGDAGLTITGDNLGDATAGNTVMTVGGGAVTVDLASEPSSGTIDFEIPEAYPPADGLSSGSVIVAHNGVDNQDQERVKLELFHLRNVVSASSGNSYFPDASYDAANETLVFAWGQSGGNPGTRNIYYLEDGDPGDVSVNQSNTSEKAHIAWGVDFDAPGANPGRVYVAYSGASGVTLEATATDTIDWSGDGYVIGAGTHNDLAVDSNGHVHVVYENAGTLNYSVITDGLTSQPTSTAIVGASTDADASWVAIALDAADRPHIVYRDADQSTLRYVYETGTGWSTPVAVVTGGDAGDYGNAIAIAGDGSVHVAYTDATAGKIWYARANSPTSAFSLNLIDDVSNNQYFPSIAVDDAYFAHITYIDTTRSLPVYARDTAAGLIVADIADAAAGPGTTEESTATVIDAAGVIHSIYFNGADLQDAIYLPETE